jgi:tRNA nucleotidyltransferase (CCA-adding enzyme)
MTQISPDTLAEDLRRAYPELAAVRDASEDPVYLVGGVVRDLLLGRGRSANLDLVVEGEAAALARRLGAEVLEHERFGTATVRLDGLEVDIAAARTESYPRPGALPEVTPAVDIAADLARRDFTVNAMAVPLEEPRLVDPLGGQADLEAGLLRVLHPGSFVDDPTRALRAARYAARLGFTLEPATEDLLRATDLEAVSTDRRDAELLRLAAEARAPRGFELLAGWGLVELRPEGVELVARVIELLAGPPWAGFAPIAPTVLRAALGAGATGGGSAADELALVGAEPDTPSDAVALASRHEPEELAVARALGAEWLDRWISEWRDVGLEIDGADLIAAGLPEGPAVGRGLAEALRMKLDGELAPGRAGELEAAIAAAKSDDGLA